jgi:phosphate transport system substrate-binding protein
MRERNVLVNACRGLVRGGQLLLVILALFCAVAPAQQISIRGSETLIYLGQRFAAMYLRESPQIQIAVQWGTTAQSVNALRAGQATVVQFEGESSAVVSPDLLSFPIGVQAIVVYVNSANPIRELTIGQLRSIFAGEITNWKTLGGPDSTILLYAGESTTGTLAYFQDSVLRGQEPYPFVGKSNTKSLLDEIASHPEAIGYGSLAQAQGTRTVAIKLGRNAFAIRPTEEMIRSRRYPITRQVSWAVLRRRSQVADALCHWALSSEGQLVVEAAGFEPLMPGERNAILARIAASASRAR